MKSNLYKFFLVILLLPLFMLNVKAEPIDPARSGSISGLYSAGTKLLTDLKVSAYKIANVNSEGILTYVDQFAPAGYELNGLTSSQTNQLMKNLDKYIGTNNIEPTASAKTNSEGKVSFSNLSTGLYLIKSDVYTDNSYTYQGMNLVTVPILNQNTYSYDFGLVAKIDINKVDDDSGGNGGNNNSNNNSNNNTSNIPNTYDSIYMYFGIFFITILGIVGIVYYISKTKRSEER